MTQCPQHAAPARIMAIASGKGGVGKTWLSITLAHALARGGARVLLMDADFGLANVDIQLGVVPERDLSALLGGASLGALVRPHAATGISLLAGRSGAEGLATLPEKLLVQVLDDLRDLAGSYDWVLLDLGAGLDARVRRIAAWATRLLVVVTPEPTSITDAYAVLKLHAADGGQDAALVVNQARTLPEGVRTHAALARACERFLHIAPPLLGVVRRDGKVADAIRHQTALLTRHPGTEAAADVEKLALALGARAGA